MIHRYLGHCLGWFDLLIWDDLSDWIAYICVVGTVWVEFSVCSYVLKCWTRCILEATFSGDMSVVLRIVGFRSRDTSIPCKSQTVKNKCPLDLLVESILSKAMVFAGKSLLLMDKILHHQGFKDDDYPIIYRFYRVLTIPGGAGFCPSTVLFEIPPVKTGSSAGCWLVFMAGFRKSSEPGSSPLGEDVHWSNVGDSKKMGEQDPGNPDGHPFWYG